MDRYRGIDYMRWFLRHLEELEPLLGLPAELRAASGLEERWRILRDALDTIIRIFADAPIVRASCVVTPLELQALDAELDAKGLQWEAVASLVPLLIDLMELLRSIELVYGRERT